MDNQDDGVQKDVQIENVEQRASSEPNDTQADQQENQEERQQESSPESKDDENITNQTEERRPTRGDRRISKLIDKLKGKDDPNPQADSRSFNELFGRQENEPFIASDEDGSLDQAETQRRMEAARLQDRELIKRELRAESEFKETVRDHLTDMEKTLDLLKDDSDLEEIVADEYHKVNYQIDPYTGQERFIPREAMSDIYNKYQKILQKRITSSQADIQVRLRNQSDGALQPSVSGESNQDYQEQALYEDAVNDGSDEKWAQVLKKRLFKH